MNWEYIKTKKWKLLKILLGMILLLILLILSLLTLFGCYDPGKLHVPRGNYYTCTYHQNCSGSIEEGFSCSGPPKFDISGDCKTTLPIKIKDKIENLRNNPPPRIAEYIYTSGLPKPDIDYPDYPSNSDSINNKLSTITCNTQSGNDENIFVIEDDLIWCTYVAGGE